MKFPYTVLLIALLPFGTVLADVVPIPGTQRVAPVFDAADLVCNCVVESIKIVSEEQLGTSPKTLLRQHVLADVLIVDRYKSTSSDTRRITVQFDREFPIMRSIPVLQKGERGLMFLKKGDLSVYEFADRLIGVTQFASFPVRDSGLGLPKLQTALASVIHMGSREDTINAMQLLEGFDELSPEAAAT